MTNETNALAIKSSSNVNCRCNIQYSETIINDSEFPLLGVRSSPPSLPTTGYLSTSPVSHSNSYAKDIYNAIQRPQYANLMRPADVHSGANSEFRIQNEDFPALPGAAHLEASHGQMKAGTCEGGVLLDGRNSERFGIEKQGIVTLSNGTVTNIPSSMLGDQFGMAGLLTFLRAIEYDSKLVGLALGTELSNLGLNLESHERNVYATFSGPWSTVSCRVQEMDVKVPEEYMTNGSIREKLPGIKLNKLSEDVLFYLFYNCPGEIYQIAAANELYGRDWRFHKSQGVWLTRSQFGFVKEQTSFYERGSYNVFDPNQWRKIPKDMTLEYKELEERPRLPSCLNASAISPRAAMNPFNSQS